MAWIRDRALTLVFMAMFLLFLVGHWLTGFVEYSDEQAQHGQLSDVGPILVRIVPELAE